MSSFFDDASLVMIPSGYKTSKVYSVKPLDGSGDLTFSRSNDTATRVNSAGLIEKVRTNLLTYSQDFSGTGGWEALFGATITRTANYGTAPDGTTTSTRIVFSGGSQIYSKTISGLTGNIGTFSLWIKGTAGETITITYGGNSDKLVTLGAGWTRFNTNGNSATNNTVYINTFLSATARDIEVWGGQVEFGDIATDYIATTTAAVSVGPVANVPRLDYLGSSCPRLLLEPQTTALTQFSESFDNAFWIKNDVTITPNTSETLDPSGYYGADKIVETATTARHRLASGATNITAANHTASVFLKKGTARYGFVAFSGAAASSIVVDLEDGTITSSSTAGTIVAQKVENYGNGWYRISITALGTSASGVTYSLQYGTAGSATPTFTSNIPSHAGSTANHLYAWGANLTATSYLQSYIPTLSAAVTRGADVASKTGISSLIGQTEGTVFADFEVTHEMTGSNPVFTVSDGTTAQNVYANIYFSGGVNRIEYVVNNGGVVQMSGNVAISNGTNKIALAYKANDFAVFINGTQVLTDTSGTVPSTSRLGVGTWVANNLFYSDRISQALLFKTRLTNAQLAELTTI